jgi:hypothetical protein
MLSPGLHFASESTLRFRAAKPHSLINERVVPQLRRIGRRDLSSLANLLFSQANRARRPSHASEPKSGRASSALSRLLVRPHIDGASLGIALREASATQGACGPP